MKCSVILANYNHALVILNALKSIEKQTYTNWEAVIVDDASTDDSLLILRHFINNSAHKQKYILIPSQHNQGESHAKFKAVEHATGEIIAICDPDDALHPIALEKIMQQHIANPEASLVFTNHFRCNSNLEPVDLNKSAGVILYSELEEDKVSHLFTFKRSAYDKTSGYDPLLTLASDKDLFYKLEEVGNIVYLDEPLYYYRVWPKGISQGFDAFVRSRDFKLTAINNAVKRRKTSGVKQISTKKLQHILADIHLLQAEGLVYSNQRLGLKFLSHLSKAILYKPSGNLKRKLKTLMLLSRLKRLLQHIFGRD